MQPRPFPGGLKAGQPALDKALRPALDKARLPGGVAPPPPVVPSPKPAPETEG